MASVAPLVKAIAELIGGALSRVFADEMKAWVPWIVERVMKVAVHRLPDDQRIRFEEEWQSHLNEIPGDVGKLLLAVSFLRAARKISLIAHERDSNPLILKRGIDLILGLTALVLNLPLFLVVPLLLRIGSRGPIFRTREMIGVNGRVFSAFAFRTRDNTTDLDNERWLARFVSRTSLDVLPLILNIVRGDMSFIGPRPLPRRYMEHASRTIPDYHLRNQVRPGLIGLAVINNRLDLHSEYADDMWYIRNRSLKVDAIIALRMILVVFTGPKPR